MRLEEWETPEEPQSLNAELTTLNGQLREKLEALDALSNDVYNVLTSADISILFLDPSLLIRRFTPPLSRLLDLTPNDVGKPLGDIMRKFRDDTVLTDAQRVLETHEPKESEVRANDGRRYIRRIYPYRTTDNRIYGVVIAFVDIEDVKQAADAVGAAKQYAESIVETVREPLVVLDRELRVVSANAAFFKDFRTTPSDTQGRRIYDLGNHQWDIPQLRALLEDILPKRGQVLDFEVEHDFPDLGPRIMILNARRFKSPALSEKGRSEEQEARILLAIEDATDRMAARRRLQEVTNSLELQVKQRTAQLEEVNRVLRAANESLDAFAYVVGHDLKEPTRAMESIFTLVEEDHKSDLTPPVATLLERARAANRRLTALVTGLLAFSRASRADAAELVPVVLDDALRSDDCTTRFRDRIAERGARLEFPGHRVVVHAHLPALCQVLGNLIENAVKHNPRPDPLVRVEAHRSPDGRTVEVVVEDNGPGFPPDVIAGLERMTTATRGFGLAIAKRSVQLHGGRLWLDRAPAGGGAVHFTLPVPPDAEAPPAGSIIGATPPVLRMHSSVDPHDHAVCVYDTLPDLIAPLGHFLQEGVDRSELTVFVHSFPTDDEAWALLARVRPDARALGEKRVVLVTLHKHAFEGGGTRIDFDHVQRTVQTLIDSAQERGCTGVRIFVDASRAYFDAARSEEWFEFETWLGHRLQLGAGLVCAYRKSDLTGDQLSAMLRTHAYRFDAPR